MTDRNKTLATFASIVGIGLCCVLVKYRSKLYRQLRLLTDFRNPLRYQNVKVVNTADECRQIIGNLKLDCAEYNVLGFDCEWVTVAGNRRPVALLQLATHKGLCALIRLSHLKRIPPELREVLEDENILKVGVAPIGDANYLTRDYGVCVANTLDLRFLAVQADCIPCSLAKLSQKHLNVYLNKDWRIRCSDWESKSLSDTQIEYAAKDAHVAIEIFKVFADRLEKRHYWTDQAKFVQNIIDKYCFNYLDIHFKTSHVLIGASETVTRRATAKGALFANKIQTRHIATRRKPLYYNCFLEAPDGEILCTCAQKKALWYVHKNIGEVVTESPFTVRLKFEPAGRAVGDTGRYYQTAKLNQCVVCGAKEKYIRKNIIPREYRKYFPFVMKGHTSHDVLLMCPHCHQISNVSDQKVRQKLAIQCDAPFSTNEGGSKTVTIPRCREIKSISRALYYKKDKIPEKRQLELKSQLLKLCPEIEEITDDLLKKYVDIETTELNEDYFAHGSKVVEYYKNQEGGLVALERLWREHFLHEMRPQFLPELWSVEHNVERLETRAHEGRIDEEDLKLAGIGRLTQETLHIDEQGNYDSDDTDSLLSQPRSDNNSTDDEDEEDKMINEEWDRDSGIKEPPHLE